MKNISVNLRPIVINLNLPTVLKTAILPGERTEKLFIATQTGEVFYTGDSEIKTFVDISSQIIELGVSSGGYDERGLLGLAFHPQFRTNGLFYLHYSIAGSQGSGALPGSSSFMPNPCDPETLNLRWVDREHNFDHIDNVEEWGYSLNVQPQKRRTLLSLRRPFMNHNGVNSLNFSPETGKLVLITGDGGAGYDPFNLSQEDMEIAGKIIEIDVAKNNSVDNPQVITRFDELPPSIQQTLTVIGKGIRNSTGISYQRIQNQFVKHVANVGQSLEEPIYSFINYKSIPVIELVNSGLEPLQSDSNGYINLGWRGWEGFFPTMIIRDCSEDSSPSEKTTAYYNEAVKTSTQRIQPITSYYHEDPRPDKFNGTALTGVQPYLGNAIPDLTECLVFTDFNSNEEPRGIGRGKLAYTKVKMDLKPSDFSVIETKYDFGQESSYYVSLGTNLDQTVLYLGVYGSSNVTAYNQGTVFEIVL